MPKRHTFLFSVAVSPAIRDITRKSLDMHHTFIKCVKEHDSPVHAHSPQYVTVLASASQQLPHILNLITQDQLQIPGKSKVMIFCNTAKMTALLAEMLQDLGASLPKPRTMRHELHSGVTQKKRRLRTDHFRNDKAGAAVLATRCPPPPAPTSTSTVLAERDAYSGRCVSALPLQEMKADKVLEDNLVLASKFDSDPKAFLKGVDLSLPPRTPSRGGRFDRFQSAAQAPRIFPKDAQGRLQQLDDVIKDALDR
ncbi:hypothetical protein FRC01_010634 [Tulasnella sp. 417]|nr:hypothetical protein FRC01_010634 [Tulasnella sp. 417]